jgi:hypothetical protein
LLCRQLPRSTLTSNSVADASLVLRPPVCHRIRNSSRRRRTSKHPSLFRRVYTRPLQSQQPHRYTTSPRRSSVACVFSNRVELTLSSSASDFLPLNYEVCFDIIGLTHRLSGSLSLSQHTTPQYLALSTAHSDGHGFPPRIFRRRFTCGCLATSPTVFLNVYVA